MKYMLLIYAADDVPEADLPPMEDWFAYSAALDEAGVNLGGEPLQSVETATTVRVRNDETVLTDGPFAETRETLGGYYMVEVDDLDQALHWAARCPGALYGSIEVRPLMALPEQA